ncbi:MAG: tyrosine-protein phosphatase [Pseudomonadota bacterium]
MNCRDLGGLPTIDGKQTARDRVYRSGRLNNLTAQDRVLFREIGIRGVFDFRLTFERENFPNPPPEELEIEEYLGGYLPDGALEMFEAVNEGTISAKQVQIGMRDQYISMATVHTDIHGALFKQLTVPNAAPFLFHCSGGKDRTGVAAALLLRTAGVNREIVIADYLLTNLDVPPLGVLQGDVSPELVQQVGFAHVELIEAAMDAVEAQFETYKDFVVDGLGLSEMEYQTLMNLLLD